MKKSWSDAAINELSIEATLNLPANTLDSDEYVAGKGWKQGIKIGSGTVEPVKIDKNVVDAMN